MKITKCMIVACFCLSLPAVAADNITVKPFLQAGLTVGGDEIYSVSYDSSSGDGTDKVKAGGLVQFGGGIQVDAEYWSVVTSFNYHADSSSGSDYGASFTRWPIETLVYYRFAPKFKLGVGYRLILSPEAELDVPGYDEKVTFRNGSGVVLEGVYNFSTKAAFAMRFAKDTYKADTVSANGSTTQISGTLDGSHLGFFLQYAF